MDGNFLIFMPPVIIIIHTNMYQLLVVKLYRSGEAHVLRNQQQQSFLFRPSNRSAHGCPLLFQKMS